MDLPPSQFFATKAQGHKEYSVDRQVKIPIEYEGITFDEGLRLDILAGKKVIVEVKAVDEVNAVWQAQVLSHLRMTKLRLGTY